MELSAKEYEQEQRSALEQERKKKISQEHFKELLCKLPELCTYAEHRCKCILPDCKRAHSNEELEWIIQAYKEKQQHENH